MLVIQYYEKSAYGRVNRYLVDKKLARLMKATLELKVLEPRLIKFLKGLGIKLEKVPAPKS